MWFWLVSNIVGSLLGAASTAYIKDTRVGIWFYAKIENFGDWFSGKYHVDIFDKEEIEWRNKYPRAAAKIDELGKRIDELEKR